MDDYIAKPIRGRQLQRLLADLRERCEEEGFALSLRNSTALTRDRMVRACSWKKKEKYTIDRKKRRTRTVAERYCGCRISNYTSK